MSWERRRERQQTNLCTVSKGEGLTLGLLLRVFERALGRAKSFLPPLRAMQGGTGVGLVQARNE